MNKETANIYLIGMMGSGKSTIGEYVARELGMNFFDSDLEIEKKPVNRLMHYLPIMEKKSLEVWSKNLSIAVTQAEMRLYHAEEDFVQFKECLIR